MRRPVSSACWLLAAAGFACSGGGANRQAPAPVPEGEGPTREEVLDACEAFARSYCESMSDCCDSVYGAHDTVACQEAFENTVCRPGADAVVAGQATFDADAAEPCLAAYSVAFDTCQADWDTVLALRADIYRACRVIDGRVDPDGGCQSSVTCKKPAGPATAICVSGKCRSILILSEGEECEFPNGDVSVCDSGLHCTSPGLEEVGVCAPAKDTDEACDPNLDTNVCGLGNYCDRSLQTCQPASNFGGPSCEQHGECVSFSCDQASSECEPAAVVALGTCMGL